MMGSRLLWAVIIGFLSGVFARSHLPIGLSYAALALLLGCAFLICGWLDAKRVAAVTLCAVTLASFALGILRMHSATLSGDPTLSVRIGTRVTLEGEVSADPDVRDTGVLVTIHADKIMFASSSATVAAGILAQLPPHASVRYGDRVRVSGTLELPQAFDAGSGRQFDYPDYLAESGIAYVLSFARCDVVASGHGEPLESAIFALKHRYLDGLDAVLPEPESGLAAGITVGDKRSIGPDLSQQFQRVGLMQLVVLSGYNITVVASAAAQVLSWSSRYIRFSSGIAVVVFFVMISGGATSAVRAGIMALLAMYARMSRRTFSPLRALGLASLVMVIWNPFTLAFDPGFQLSAVAMAGLTALTPIFARGLAWIPERFGLREMVSSTVATQLAVLPLLLYQNGQLSIYAVPANMFAMLPVPLAMLSSLIASVGGMFFGAGAEPLALPAHMLLSYIIAVGRIFASLPFSSVSIGTFDPIYLAAAYGLLCGFVWRFGERRKNPTMRDLPVPVEMKTR